MSYILVIDDDEDLADATATVLRSDGHEVAVEHNIDSGFRKFTERQPDAVVLDVMFPDNSSGGFDLARKIAAVTRKVPILMLTAVNSHYRFGFSEKDIDGEWMPVTHFLEKPVDFTLMKKTVSDMIAKAKQG